MNPEFSKELAQIDLGRLILSGAIILGFFLAILTVIRSIEIPIRIYLDKQKEKREQLEVESKLKSNKGFNDDV